MVWAPAHCGLSHRGLVPDAARALCAQTAGSERNTPLENHLLQHSRLRRLGPLDEEQVEVGPLLGRGSFGRVFKGAPSLRAFPGLLTEARLMRSFTRALFVP